MLISSRTTNILLILVLAVGVGIVAMLASGVRGGPLDPPGPPASTDAVRLPGTPISTAPVTIATPGHYYVTRNLFVAGAQTAITIAADDVSVDLAGFTIDGDDTPSSWGIRLSGDRQNVAITNGTLRDFHFGVDSPGILNRNIILRNVNALSNIRGLSLVGTQFELTDCTANDNEETGIYLGADRGVVRHCSARFNQVDGIAVGGNRNVIEWDTATNNQGVDINVIGGSFNIVRDNEIGDVVLAANSGAVAMDNHCLVLTGAGGTNTTAATSHQNVGC